MAKRKKPVPVNVRKEDLNTKNGSLPPKDRPNGLEQQQQGALPPKKSEDYKISKKESAYEALMEQLVEGDLTHRDVIRRVLLDHVMMEKREVVGLEELAAMFHELNEPVRFTGPLNTYLSRLNDIVLLKKLCMIKGLNQEECSQIVSHEIENKFKAKPKQQNIVLDSPVPQDTIK